jgi:hypothetical protein
MRFDQKRFERRSFDISHLGEKYPKDENRLFFQRLNGITDNYTNEKLYYINSHDIEEGITMIEDLERKLSNEIKMANRYWWGGYYFVRK